jgi:hemoglobin/transferrin/lactoferrin receptor protein
MNTPDLGHLTGGFHGAQLEPVMNLHLHLHFRRRSILGLVLLTGLLTAPSAAQAQEAPPPKPASDSSGPADPKTSPTGADAAPAVFETVTVSATLNPATLKETPGTVSVIDARTIARRLIENSADLVKFEPGVYVETNLTRVGLNGFNIRGIGGNRVMTQVDGVETSEQFDFGPFNVHQFTLDLDTLKSAEIMRSAGSALYGSDALGGVVSLFTKDPADYLAGQRYHAGAKTTFDSRSDDTSGNAVVAGGRGRLTASAFVSYAAGHEPDNRGTVRAENATRTALNPQDRRGVQALGKAVLTLSPGNVLRAAVEIADTRVETQAFSSRSAAALDVRSDDGLARHRVSIDQSLVGRGGLTQWSWNLYAQQSDTGQVVDELRAAAGATPRLNRHGTLDYAQDSAGGTIQGRKAFGPRRASALATFGGSYRRHAFDMIRDRVDVNAATGVIVPPVNLVLPTKYFPKSNVGEAAGYAQAEVRWGRLLVVPGLRVDRYSLDADHTDAVFLASLSPAPADFSADAVSSKLGASLRLSNAVTVHAQYAGGFRAPPYSAVNSGFTNLQGGYTSIPNTALRAETSDNVDLGVRATFGTVSLGATAFTNHYDQFIQQASRGVNPQSGLIEFQYQNVATVEIHGLELQGDARLPNGFRLRGSYAVIRGSDTSADTDVPLDTIAPDQGVLGLAYAPSAGRWGGELSVRAVHGAAERVAATTPFAPPAYAVVDLTGWLAVTRDLTIRAGALNLTDARYWEWPNVRGRAATDPTIDRYTSPGVGGLVSLSYGW